MKEKKARRKSNENESEGYLEFQTRPVSLNFSEKSDLFS